MYFPNVFAINKLDHKEEQLQQEHDFYVETFKKYSIVLE